MNQSCLNCSHSQEITPSNTYLDAGGPFTVCESCSGSYDIDEAAVQPAPAVVISEDSISIRDEHGEIVQWIDDEWTQDPAVTTTIAHAIELFYTQGTQALRELIGRPIQTGSDIQ